MSTKLADPKPKPRHASRSDDAVKRAQTFRLYPTPEQAAKLELFIAGARWFFNQAVAHHRARAAAYKKAKAVGGSGAGAKLETLTSMAYAVKIVRSPECVVQFRHGGEWHHPSSVPSQVLHGALHEVDRSCRLYFAQLGRGRPASLPGFRSEKRGPWSIRFQVQAKRGPAPIQTVMVSTGSDTHHQIKVVGVGGVRARVHRQFHPDTLVNAMCVAKDNAGRWWVTLQIDTKVEPRTPTGVVLGVDRGVTSTLVSDQGHVFDTPSITTGLSRRKKALEQSLARSRALNPCNGDRWAKVAGRARLVHRQHPEVCAETGCGCWKVSARYERTRVSLAKIIGHEAAQRHDAAHKASRALANIADVVVMEDLNVQGMMASAKGTEESPGCNVAQKSGLNREIAGRAWYSIESKTAYKTELAKVPAAYTSQTCPACGHVDPANRNEQVFRCTACGWEGHADQVGGHNIKNRWSPSGDPTAGAQSVAGRGALSEDGCESSMVMVGPSPEGAEHCDGGNDLGNRSLPDQVACLPVWEPILLVPEEWGVGTARTTLRKGRSRRPARKRVSSRNDRGKS